MCARLTSHRALHRTHRAVSTLTAPPSLQSKICHEIIPAQNFLAPGLIFALFPDPRTLLNAHSLGPQCCCMGYAFYPCPPPPFRRRTVALLALAGSHLQHTKATAFKLVPRVISEMAGLQPGDSTGLSFRHHGTGTLLGC